MNFDIFFSNHSTAVYCEVKTIKDKIVQEIKDKFERRSQLGIKKYGTTLERDDLTAEEWVNHLQDELMDAILYLQRLKHDINGK